MSQLAATVLFLSLGGVLLARLGRADDEGRATGLVRAALWTFGLLVALLETLGVAGLASPRAMLIAAIAVCAGVAAATRRLPPVPARRPAEPWTPLELGLLAALVTALATRGEHGLHRTTFLYDTLSYHLHAPVTWMHDARVSIVPAVFGDGAPAYAPSNVELLFWLLMAPLRSDFLAQTGQLPLAALACAAIAAAIRQAGGPRAAALAAALAFLMVPEVWQQAATAMVDLGMAAFFLAGAAFLLRLERGPRPADAAALGLALGLCAGTKVVGLLYALPLAALALPSLARAPRAARAALGAAVATGGFWYARNLAVTGNPLYPMTVKLGGATMLPGLVDGAAARASDYHVPIGDVAALGRLFLDAGLAFSLAGVVGLARASRATWALLAAALTALFWLVVPYQESRFLFPVLGVVAIALGSPRGGVTPWRWAPLALSVAGGVLEQPTAARCGALAVGAGVGLGAGWLRARTWAPPWRRPWPRWWVAAGAIVCGAAAAELRDELATYRARDPGYDVGDALGAAWSWARAHVRGARVAYTGNNLPFPLAGAELANDVRYVNVAGAAGALLHDFAPSAGVTGLAEPAPYRDGAGYETWRANLRATRRELLFVAALYPEVRRTIAHDAQGFPVERAWADAHPETFTLRFASEAARVYAVAP